MTVKNRMHPLLAAFFVLVVVAVYVGNVRTHIRTLLRPAPVWTNNTDVATQQILVGTISSLGNASLVVQGTQPQSMGTNTVSFGPSTGVSKQIPKTPAELAAAFKEFQRLQKESNGKPFVAPDASTVVAIKLSDLKVGDSVVITLEPGSTDTNFVAKTILVVPAQQG